MACCKPCCGCKNCAEGEQGKCCCGGPTGTCCTQDQWCCDGACSNETCTPPRCQDCPTPPTFTVTYKGVAVPAFPFGDIICNKFDATGNLQSKVIVRDSRARCRPDGKWEVTARKIHECTVYPAILVANLIYDYKWVIEPKDQDGCPSAVIDFTLTTTTIDNSNLLNTANCNEECWTDDELILAVT